jgi:eukaryotic-like serine/threonine-protein kinase
MGEVYAAYDPELDRKVAVKLLRVKAGNGVSLSEGRQRTLREAQAIARLSHPNVVVVFDVGTFEEKVFIAMEFVDGNTVTYWLEQKPRTWREILNVFIAAGRGLIAAHEKGLVHRDFKPDNVMVGKDGQVRVMDFGLARQMGAKPVKQERARPVTPSRGSVPIGSGTLPIEQGTLVLNTSENTNGSGGMQTSVSGLFDARLTRTGAMMGTPAYMAPEQFFGANTDARTDQFSFCVALYEAVYDQRPFGGETFQALMTSVTMGEVRPAPPKASVPGWIRRALLCGLTADPQRRYPSMTALLAALTTDPTVRLRRAAAVAGVVLCVVAGLVALRRASDSRQAMCRGGGERLAGVWEAGRQRSPRKDAIHRAFLATRASYAEAAFASASRYLDEYANRWASMYGDACEATQVRGEQSAEVLDLRMACLNERLTDLRALTDVFATADGKVVENAVTGAGSLARLDRCADVPLLRAVIKPPADDATRARVQALRTQLAHLKAMWRAGRCADAQPLANDLLSQIRAVGYQPLLAEGLLAVADDGEDCSPATERIGMIQEAFAAALASHHDEVAAQAAAVLPTVLSDRFRQPLLARQWVTIGRAAIARIGGNPILDATLDHGESSIFSYEGRGADAIAAARRARQTQEKRLGEDHPYAIACLNGEGLALQMAGQYPEALATLTAARDRSVHALGAAHPNVAMTESNRGEVLNALRRFPEARAAFGRAIAIWTESQVDPMLLSYAQTGVGLASIGDRRPLEAIAPLEAALQTRLTGKAAPELLGETRFALARALWAKPAERPRAEELARKARADYLQGEKHGDSLLAPVAQIDSWLATAVASL